MLDDLGNVGDFLGGIGVVVTLVYLALQIRQNTASGRAAAYQEATKALSDWSSSLARDADAMRIYLLGTEDPDKLDELEREQFRLLITSLFRHFENLHFQYLQGAMDSDTWAGWQQRIAGTLAGNGIKRFWQSQKKVFSPKFQEFVERSVPERDGTPFRNDR